MKKKNNDKESIKQQYTKNNNIRKDSFKNLETKIIQKTTRPNLNCSNSHKNIIVKYSKKKSNNNIIKNNNTNNCKKIIRKVIDNNGKNTIYIITDNNREYKHVTSSSKYLNEEKRDSYGLGETTVRNYKNYKRIQIINDSINSYENSNNICQSKKFIQTSSVINKKPVSFVKISNKHYNLKKAKRRINNNTNNINKDEYTSYNKSRKIIHEGNCTLLGNDKNAENFNLNNNSNNTNNSFNNNLCITSSSNIIKHVNMCSNKSFRK